MRAGDDDEWRRVRSNCTSLSFRFAISSAVAQILSNRFSPFLTIPSLCPLAWHAVVREGGVVTVTATVPLLVVASAERAPATGLEELHVHVRRAAWALGRRYGYSHCTACGRPPRSSVLGRALTSMMSLI